MWKRRAELPDERMRPSAAQPRSRDGASERALRVAMRCGDYRYLGLQLLGLSESMGRRCAAAKTCLGSGLGSNCRSTCRASSVERRKLVIHPCSSSATYPPHKFENHPKSPPNPPKPRAKKPQQKDKSSSSRSPPVSTRQTANRIGTRCDTHFDLLFPSTITTRSFLALLFLDHIHTHTHTHNIAQRSPCSPVLQLPFSIAGGRLSVQPAVARRTLLLLCLHQHPLPVADLASA